MADTGCQSCLAGLNIVKKLGLSLLPSKCNIPILGATILVSTRQIVYIIKHTDKLFLSREACTDLGIILSQFPLVNKITRPSQGDSIGATNTPQQCQCPKRTQPPPVPTTLPYPATEENRAKLQQYLPIPI